MASSLAVPRTGSHTSVRLKSNLPVIEHPMAKLGNKSELSIRGSSSLSFRRGNTVVTVNNGRAELGLHGTPVKHDVNREIPNYFVKKSEPERMLQWPPVIEHTPPFKYRESATERTGLLQDANANKNIRMKRMKGKQKGIILPSIKTLMVTGKGSKRTKETFKFPSLDTFLDAIAEESEEEYMQGPRRSLPKKTEVSLQYVSRSPLELSDMIKEKLTSGYYGLRHLFKANDPTGQGNVSREALNRILLSLCGYISADQYTRFLKKFNLEGKDTISFDTFVSCFKDNETVKKEWVSPVQRLAVEDSFATHRPEENLRRSDVVYHDPYTSAPFADKLFRERMKTIDDIKSILPPACFTPDGMVVPPQLREAFAQLGIYVTDAEFTTLWQRFDTEGLGAIYTSKLLRKLGIDTTRKPKTFGGNECVQRSKDKTHRRSNSQIVTVETEETVTVKNETNNQKASEIRFNHEKFSEKNALNMTEVSTTHNESQTTGNNTKIQTSRKVGIRTEVPQETSMGIDPNKTKVLKAAIKKQVPKLDNIIDCLHYRFEESYNALSTAFNLFDQLEDGYIARLDFRRVLQEFGLNSSVTDLDYFLSRIGLRSIRGQINYKEFLNKFQSKAENSITTRIVTNKQYLFQQDLLPMQKSTLNAEEMEAGVVSLLHGDFLKLINYFRSCDKYCLGVITPHEFKSGIEKRLGYLMSERQWEQLKTDVGQDKDGLIPYTKFLQLFDVFPGSWNKRQEGNIDVMQISPDDMPQPSAVNRLKEKAKSYMTQRDISVPRMDGTRTVAEIQKLLDELFKNRMHTFDKHFKEMDRKMMGRMSKWQFGALLKLCGLILTTSELDKIWGTLNVGSDGMYSYSALIRHFIQFKVLPGAEEKQNPIFEDTRELIEAAKLIQRERREHRLKSELEKTTTNISHSHTVEVEHANARESQHEISLIQQNQAPPKPCTTVMNTMQPSYVVTKPLSTKDLLVKCKQDVINNWNGLKSVFKFVDKGGTATITINEMMEVMLSMNFKLSEEEKNELCTKFDLQRSGRFHYLEFMKCFSQNTEVSAVNQTKMSVTYNKYSHKLEHKLLKEHKNLRRAFKKLDIYNRGYLEVGDFRKALSACKIEVTNEDFYHMMSEFDTSLRGKISYQDFLTTLLSV